MVPGWVTKGTGELQSGAPEHHAAPERSSTEQAKLVPQVPVRASRVWAHRFRSGLMPEQSGMSRDSSSKFIDADESISSMTTGRTSRTSAGWAEAEAPKAKRKKRAARVRCCIRKAPRRPGSGRR